MADGRGQSQHPDLTDAVQALERRVARLEAQLALATASPTAEAPIATAAPMGEATELSERDFEFEVGQNWLASVGILVLASGVGFTLLLPFPGVPSWLPSAAGGLIAVALAALAARWHQTFALVAGYFRGAAMALCYCAVLRLFFFGAEHALSLQTAAGEALLIAVAAANVAGAVYRRSAWLMAIALVTGFVTLVAIGAPWTVMGGLALLLTAGAWAVVSYEWPWLQLLLIPAGYVTFLLWLVNRPWQGRAVALQSRPVAGAVALLLYALINAAASYRRRTPDGEDAATILSALLNCGIGYGTFLLATSTAPAGLFGSAHAAAAAVFLGIGLAFWQSETSRVSTFLYAMTGYLALSVALARLVSAPNLFIWLSGESLLVVATALWFRSKMIVLGNFFIYVAIVLAYVLVAQRETGISIGLGIVALLTARILGWQAQRLELKTEMMRNAYLISAFVVFPYALYHLVPRAWVPVSWVAMAVAYYGMNLVVRSPKYRWMGHFTLLLTALYTIVVGIFQLAPAYRIASFLVLGTVLLVVSLIFTMVRARRREASAAPPKSPVGVSPV
ncbi:MAG: hypothetical protein HYV19_00610 [Gemmatimonadetes bacterium]|nr:hypothetical protein [Gemmatimonadota bacterium]